MTMNPYDEVPYKCLPVEWTAPERLALASLLHGGPRPALDRYRVLELGCGDGANLLPQAYFRRHAAFVGVDGAATQVAMAERSRRELGLSNVEFVHADFLAADECLTGQFDFIVGHGIFSWVPGAVRDALLRLCARRLRPGGLLYLNYNAYPGWKVRGLVRDFLLAQTAGVRGLGPRALAAQEAAGRIARSLPEAEHAYSKLLADEFRFVCDSDASYVAHEYLASVNDAYWRSEFGALLASHGLEVVADADFNYASGRLPEDIGARLRSDGLTGRAEADTVDLLCYRQLHSPIVAHASFIRHLPTSDEFAGLFLACCLVRYGQSAGGHAMFQHPSGYEVEAKEDVVASAFETLAPLWPGAAPVGALFPDVSRVMADLQLLHRNGLVELRCVVTPGPAISPEPLQAWETANRGYTTSAFHQVSRIAAVA